MDSKVLGQKATEWELYRDALAPTQNKPLPKPWDRAPVSAHAPRLQGRQIWKKAGIRTQTSKESDSSRVELEMEGTGARKRLRFAGGKENITNVTDALWLPNPGKLVPEEEGSGNSKEGERFGEEDTLRFVPRKRTNTNHVITPRKPLRQTTLNGQAKTVSSQTPEKPARRRKSVRKSMRNSTAAVPSERVTTPMVCFRADLEHRSEAQDGQESEKSEAIPPTVRRSSGISIIKESTDPETHITASSQRTTEDEVDFTHDIKPEQSLDQEEPTQTRDYYELTSENIMIPLNDPKDQLKKLSTTHNVESPAVPIDETVNKEAVEACPQSLENKTLVPSSVENDVNVEWSHPLNATETPRKRKGKGMRRGTRRSTRTRPSSFKVEEQPGQAITTTTVVNAVLMHEEIMEPHMGPNSDSDEAPVPHNILGKPGSGEDTPNRSHTAVVEPPLLTGLEPIQTIPDTTPGLIPVSFDLDPVLDYGSFESQNGVLERQKIEELLVAAEYSPVSRQPEHQISQIGLDEDLLPDPAESLDTHADSPSDEVDSQGSSPIRYSASERELSPSLSDEQTVEILETIEPIFVPADETLSFKMPNKSAEGLPESSTLDPSTSALVETFSEHAQSAHYDHDDTDMLRNFLTRVKASKAAKAEKTTPRRKRSLPHSPLQIPLGGAEGGSSPSELKDKDEFDISLPVHSPSKRSTRNDPVVEAEIITQPKSIRRSGRTRLPIVKSPVAAPSFIPVRRLGGDGDNTVTLKRSEEKALAALTRVNTRKNKGSALSAAAVLMKKAEEKDDPYLRQRLLKELFDEKAQKNKREKEIKSVAWAVEIAQFQGAGGKKVDAGKDEKEKGQEKVVEEKKGALRVVSRSKIAMGVPATGTPAPKRKTRER